MAATVPRAIANLEALNPDNYEYWSFRVKTYLLGKDLWDVVEDTNEPPKLEDGIAEFKAWRKNNARALHSIIIACGKDAEFFIRGKKTARDAWNTLDETFAVPENLDDEADVFRYNWNDETDSIEDGADLERAAVKVAANHETFCNHVSCHDWDPEFVQKHLTQYPEAIRAKYKDGETVLYRAVWNDDLVAVKDAESFIRGKEETARDAWTTLAKTFAAPENLVAANHETFCNHVSCHDWDREFVQKHLTQHPEAIRAKYKDGETVLHRAVRNDDLVAVKEWLPLLKNKDLEIPDKDGDTALYMALLSLAMSCQKSKLARYLYSVTPIDMLESGDRAQLVSIGLQFKILDIPFDILRRYPNLVLVKDHYGESPLSALASTRFGLFSDTSNLPLWNRWIYNCIDIPPARTPARTPKPGSRPTYFEKIDLEAREEEKNQGKVSWFVAKLSQLSGMDHIYQKKLLHKQATEILDCMCSVLNIDNLNRMQHKFVVRAIFQAVEQGNVPFIKHIVNHREHNPWISSITNKHDKTVFQFAAEHRQAKIFDLMSLYGKEKVKEFVSRQDKFGNNMLHAIGKLAPLTQNGHIQRTALQMQNELQWFKKVEGMGNPNILNCTNSDGHTPREEFTMNHKNLVEVGEKSMKETATSSSALVAALIITIMFAAAVTVPGGVNGDTGIPIYLHTKAFRIFMVADVVSLCFSTTSVMIFLGILTSRFSEEDFLISLPTKLIIGFLTVFISIGAMMVAFSSAILIMLPENSPLVIPSIILAGVPIASFSWTQFPFLVELIISTYI